jgi:hypothetical protein
MTEKSDPICRFYRLIDGAPEPERANRSAEGMMSMRAYQYCEAMRSAAANGFYVFPPTHLWLMFDGKVTQLSLDGEEWQGLTDAGAQYPHFTEYFRRTAPEVARSYPPLFLQPLYEPGAVQIWTGYFAKTAPGWSLLSRPPVNIPERQAYRNFEGIVETDRWVGPLFANIQLTHTHFPVQFAPIKPLMQVQLIPRESYRDPPFEILDRYADLPPADWETYTTMAARNAQRMSGRPGAYAVEVRKRGHAECQHAELATS